jgi:hypothetical protein
VVTSPTTDGSTGKTFACSEITFAAMARASILLLRSATSRDRRATTQNCAQRPTSTNSSATSGKNRGDGDPTRRTSNLVACQKSQSRCRRP